MAVPGLLLVAAIASVPLEPGQQALFAAVAVALFLALGRLAGRFVSVLLAAVSLAVSLRYLVWRLTATLDLGTAAEQALGIGLVLAEIYAVLVLALGYLQSIWPLDRKPRPLPADPDSWPAVDVFIPTYNEPLPVVRATVLAAMGMDWPGGKLAVYLLDDGRRDELRAFAAQAGCHYLTRADNRHAKAGNLNAALRQSQGEYVAVFDCDHIPTRAFLQMTLGWLVADPKLAVVQTPQHHYSPDPFQRNLDAGSRAPAEGNLFHGLLQNGNDFWGAAMFSGTGAVLRRAALDSIGGFATETVTEDAHTMLKLHRRGWGSAFLRLPLSAGLAPERLSAHIAQRQRWARGMLHILRADNPLFGPGLTLAQRLCYLQATLHFLFALPRLAFLTAPLAFLLLGQNVIAASPLAITAYAAPHIVLAIATNSRLHGSWRHAFWSEIYETVLALFMVRLTLATLFRPRRGRFGVTAKGGGADLGGFDLRAAYPNLILAALLVAGIVRGVAEAALFPVGPLTFDALVLNSVWAALALLAVLAALAAARETRQPGGRPWLRARLKVGILLPDGREVAAAAQWLSQEGGRAVAERPEGLPDSAGLHMVFALGGERLALPARVLRWDDAGLQVAWQPATLEEEALVVRAVFSRADAWADWASAPADRPLVSLWRVIASIRGLFRSRTATVAGALLAAALAAMPAQAQQTTPPRKPAVTAQPLKPPASGTTVRVIPQTVAPAAPSPAPPPAEPPQAAAPAAAPAQAAAEAPKASTRRVIYTLRQLGAAGPLALRGTNPVLGVEFGVRGDEVVTSAQLALTGALSPSLIPESSNVVVTLNDQYVGTIPASRGQANFSLDLPVSPVFVQDGNRLNFRFTGRVSAECADPLSGLLWATINDSSTLTLTLERLPPQRDLARLPQPFFDAFQRDTLVLPFVLAGGVSNDSLRAAGIAASWFGALAGSRGVDFPVLSEPPPEGNAVLLLVGGEGRTLAGLPAIDGPTLAVIANPNDRLGSLLVIAGRNAEETVTAATALAVASHTLGGPAAGVRMPQLAARLPYDAPNWIAANRPVKLGELVDASALQTSGYLGQVQVPFRTAPDFYTWRNRPFDLDLRYRAPAGPVIDLGPSRLDVGIDGTYLDTLSLAPADSGGWLARLLGRAPLRTATAAHIGVPVHDIAGSNTLQFAFDARPLHRGDCAAAPQDLRMAIDPESSIDLSAGHRFAELPNLAFFAGSGFPFTRMADLSETAVVLPERPNGIEIGAFLDLMGYFGGLTGLPALRVAVTQPDGIAALADRDLLLLGTLPRLGAAGALLQRAAARPEGNRLAVTLSDPLDPLRRVFGDRIGAERGRAAAAVSAAVSESTAALVGAESPLHAGRSLVAILGGAPPALEAVVAALRDPAQMPQIQGDLTLLTGGKLAAFRVTAPYAVGTLPVWLWPSWYLHDKPLSLVALMLAGCALLGAAMYWSLRRRAAARLRDGNPGA